ncbi:hypothetical protein [Loigolactobacillus backii]|uniref:hypothetical protein n=1 Tax=Loigolactobacillus backii TaxID=375175 RepID=UPI0007F051DF|nr:hypothetical protein [Loigolactobacillus backii]ANK59815.1 hypothetical protein AYR52_05800 [Loigolactobacillus backii]
MADSKQEQETRPTIEYQAVKNYEDQMNATAEQLKSMGVNDVADSVAKMKRGLDNGIPQFLHVIGVKAATTARETERSMVGHGRSGYVPSGNLMRSITSYDRDLATQVYPNAIASDGKTEYGGFVEDGTRKHPIPEPYMGNADKAMVDEINKQLASLSETVNGGAK